MNANENDYLYLNRDLPWPDFQRHGLEVRSDGALQLSSVPLLEGELLPEIASLDAPQAPAGLAVDAGGTIYFSDPASNRLWRIDGCSRELSLVPCAGARDGVNQLKDGFNQLSAPRGLLIPKHRDALFVADSGNHRIVAFDLNSFQLLDVWGRQNASDAEAQGAEPGRFNSPWALTADSKGNLYVVDEGNHRVQKFNIAGDVRPSFWETLHGEGVLDQPVDIASDEQNSKTRLYIADRTAGEIFVVEPDGHVVRDAHGRPVSFGRDGMQPMGIVATSEAVYVGDNAEKRVLKFRKQGTGFVFAGEAAGYRGPVAALALDCHGHLLVHTGLALRPLRLLVDKGYSTRGILWSAAITPQSPQVDWHRLRAEAEALAPTAHLQFFLHVAKEENQPPADPTVGLSVGSPFTDPKWQPMPPDVSDLFIGGEGRYLWIGALFSGDGTETPVIRQMLLEYNHESYINHLPAIYRNYASCGDFLERLLALCESFYNEVEDRIASMPSLFDPMVVPEDFLDWLAGWMALELDEKWDEDRQRRILKEAFETYALRGTTEGLQLALRNFGGVNAVIEEPVLNAGWWALPSEQEGCKPRDPCANAEKEWEGTENSLLGFTTMLAPEEAQGAVVGTTAQLDGSHLITEAEFGSSLFSAVAHQFIVQVRSGQLRGAESLSRLRRIIEREKPAHTTYHLCVLEPRMRVGFQARVGIDTIVGGPPQAGARLGEGLAMGSPLGGEPAGRIGERSLIGVTTRVG